MKLPVCISPAARRCLALVAISLLAACAKVNDTGLRLVSTSTDAYLMVNGQWLTGQVLLVPDRTGRVSFAAAAASKGTADDAAAEAPEISACVGSMRYTATYGADIDLHCDDGTQLVLRMTLISETRGYGYGATPQGPASLAFGLAEADARAFMGRVATE